ncbi:MAG: glutamate racemase [Brevinematia bacterium]
MDKRPIGVFDSGVGGLTVLKQIKKYLPNESIIYLGDTKHLPYGDKSKEAIIRFSIENTKFLIKNDVKAIVVACNSASSVAIEPLKEMFKIPIIGVIEPTVECIVKSPLERILVIGTIRTITSGMYEKKIREATNKEVFGKACPLFVPLIEEGAFIKNNSYLYKSLQISIIHYLEEFRNKVDGIVLGCTHYPLIAKEIEEYMGKVKLIDPGECAATKIKELLESNNLLSNEENHFEKYFVTDLSERTKQVVNYIMEKEIKIEEVYISDL